jgi:hypothetical protein
MRTTLAELGAVSRLAAAFLAVALIWLAVAGLL